MSGRGDHATHREKTDQGSHTSREQEEREEWKQVADHDERRRIQNRQAQRRFREKEKRRKEERALEAQNQQAAGGAYTSPEASDLEHDQSQSGLPWGGVSIRHVVERGRAKEGSQGGSREASVPWTHRREDTSRQEHYE